MCGVAAVYDKDKLMSAAAPTLQSQSSGGGMGAQSTTNGPGAGDAINSNADGSGGAPPAFPSQSIDEGQPYVKPLAPGQTSGNTGFNPTAYFAANPDVAAEYSRVSANPGANQQLASSGALNSPEAFAAWHYQNFGKSENRPGAGGEQVGGDGAVQSGNNLITSLTEGFNQTIAELQRTTQTQIDTLTGNNNTLTKEIMGLNQTNQTNQRALLDEMNSAAARQSQEFAKALKDLRDAGNSTGQAAKKPNYMRALAKNRELNSTGLSSTMITGPGGVKPGTMTLGSTSLLGA